MCLDHTTHFSGVFDAFTTTCKQPRLLYNCDARGPSDEYYYLIVLYVHNVAARLGVEGRIDTSRRGGRVKKLSL